MYKRQFQNAGAAFLSFLCMKREASGQQKGYNGSWKGAEAMEWIERLNQAVSYIEEHIMEEIDYQELAQTACCSVYHFQRMFTYMAGVSLSEYIRRRRMSLAAVDLQDGDQRILDISLKYGYSSPTAFNLSLIHISIGGVVLFKWE